MLRALRNVWVWMNKDVVAQPLQAILAVVLYCLIGSLAFCFGQELSIVDSIYFMVVTMSTVGYGDFSPSSDGLKAFIVIWVFVAIIVVFPKVTASVALFTNGWKEWSKRQFERLQPPTMVDINGDGIRDFALPDAAWLHYTKHMLPSMLLNIVMQLVAAGVFVAIEGWYYGDAFYHCLITATTVGYGDIRINTEGGRLWACVQILISVAMLGELVSTFNAARGEYAQKAARMRQLQKKMNPHLSDNLLATVEQLQGKGGGGGMEGVSKMQFFVSMLVESGVIDKSELDAFKTIFERANTDKNGTLSKKSLKRTILAMQADLAIAASSAGLTFEPVPPPEQETAKVAPAPPPPVLSDDALQMVEDAALSQVTLGMIKLSLVNRQIKLLRPIEFNGTTFEDEALAREISGEIANVLTVCNKMLTERSLPVFGLTIGGHTSQDAKSAESSKETSFTRAKQVSMLIAEKLVTTGGEEYAPVLASIQETGKAKLPGGGTIVTVGFGSTQRLPGFDDGGNYKENRRVEVKLLFEA